MNKEHQGRRRRPTVQLDEEREVGVAVDVKGIQPVEKERISKSSLPLRLKRGEQSAGRHHTQESRVL